MVGTRLAMFSTRVIRITTQREKSHTVVTIDGQLSAADVGELQRVRESLQGKVVLELGGLSVCANEGVRLLQDWLQAGAQLNNTNPFLRMVLEKHERV